MEIVTTVGAYIGEHLHNAINIEENLKNLDSKMEELNSIEDDINTKLKGLEVQKGKKRKREVEVWLAKKQKLTTEVDGIKQEIFESGYFSRLKLGKRVAKKIKEVSELLDRSRFSDDLVVDTLASCGLTLTTTTLVGEAAQRNLEIIWEWMLNDEINKIGIYGMGGVGKTTIMTHINNLLKQNNYFDDVIWVTVSKALDIERFQKDIAQAIKIDLSKDQDQIIRAAKLQENLKRRKRFVLILDDMWEVFPLEEVGIPIPCRENGCKLVLTSRSFEVCQGMKCQKEIKVEVLSEEESWNLFIDKVRRDDMVLAPEAEEIARLVAQECAGLPLTLVMVGGTMSGKEDICEWSNALDELKSSTKGVRKLKDKVIERLKFSYNWLRDKNLKNCFLYCALYPEDYAIPVEELIEFWIAEQLIDDDERNKQARVCKSHVILNILRNNGMLERAFSFGDYGYRNIECVKIHDSVRDMALDITSVSPRFMVQAGDQLITKPPKEEKWREDLERVSLMRNDIMEISYTPRCPILTTLLLQKNPLSKGISDSFFEHMPSLRVLDLSKTKIKHLPHSISDLKNLRALLLRDCRELTDVPSLENLVELRVLDLRNTGITEFPQGMGRLVNLRRLALSYTHCPRMLPSGLLSMLSFLEDLEKLMNLTHLEILSARFSDIHTFNKYARSEHVQQLKTFRLSVGNDGCYTCEHSATEEKFVSVHRVNLIDENNSLALPHNTQDFYISNCNDITSLSELYCLKNMRDLKICNLRGCKGIKCILLVDDEEVCPSFLPSLNYLCFFLFFLKM